MKEIRRRTRVVGAFPDAQSCLNLTARLRYIAGKTWLTKCYMNMRPLYQQHLSETEAVASMEVSKLSPGPHWQPKSHARSALSYTP
jgi:hypothetical protein